MDQWFVFNTSPSNSSTNTCPQSPASLQNDAFVVVAVVVVVAVPPFVVVAVVDVVVAVVVVGGWMLGSDVPMFNVPMLMVRFSMFAKNSS